MVTVFQATIDGDTDNILVSVFKLGETFHAHVNRQRPLQQTATGPIMTGQASKIHHYLLRIVKPNKEK